MRFTKQYIKRLKTRNKKNKDPDSMPFILTIIPIIVMGVYLYMDFPNFDPYRIITAIISCMVLYIFLLVVWKLYFRVKLAGSTISDIDRMSGEAFEQWLALMYKNHGFSVKTTPKTCDFGADLIIRDPKTGKKASIQAKRYRNLVGEEAVQQTISGREYYKCDNAMIITNSHYTDAAKKLAKSCNVAMIDRYSLGKEKMYDFNF